MGEISVIKVSATIESDDDEDAPVALPRSNRESPFDNRHSVAGDEEGRVRPCCGGKRRRELGRHICEHDDYRTNAADSITSSVGDGEITIMWEVND